MKADKREKVAENGQNSFQPSLVKKYGSIIIIIIKWYPPQPTRKRHNSLYKRVDLIHLQTNGDRLLRKENNLSWMDKAPFVMSSESMLINEKRFVSVYEMLRWQRYLWQVISLHWKMFTFIFHFLLKWTGKCENEN